jgi:hypothetical protein
MIDVKGTGRRPKKSCNRALSPGIFTYGTVGNKSFLFITFCVGLMMIEEF